MDNFARKAAAPMPAAVTPTRVLVVDDDPVYRETSRMFLSMYGREVSLAENGTAGLQLAERQDFDVMIVDIEMPDMTGLEVIARIRQIPRHRDVPIIIVTGRDDAMVIDRAYELGASSFVVKPVNWTLLDHYVRFVRRAADQEQDARRAHAAAEALSRTKDNLLAIVRHEVKTPLSAILGFTKLAAEAQAANNMGLLHERLDFVRESGERLLTCLGDMTAYSDLLSRRVEFQPDMISPSWIFGEAQETRARRAEGSGVSLTCNEGDISLRILADQSLLTSAIVRLIDNALHHARDATLIRLAVVDHGQDIGLVVSDNGSGMDPDRIEECLMPFSQENMSKSRSANGLGIGLPIVSEIARLHGGRLELRSVPGKGTDAEIVLPKAEPRGVPPTT